MTSIPDAVTRQLRAVLVALAVGMLRIYQFGGRVLYTREHCRFYPSCSAYALQAFRVHGPWRGLWFALRRLGRCHPFNPGGVDHVPQPVE